jgi:hypothetical protein
MSEDESKLDLEEKGWLGVLITGSTVAAFLASNLYVFGLSSALNQNLANYFEILDYLQVTPAWGVPTLLSLILIMTVPALAHLAVHQKAIIRFFEKAKEAKAQGPSEAENWLEKTGQFCMRKIGGLVYLSEQIPQMQDSIAALFFGPYLISGILFFLWIGLSSNRLRITGSHIDQKIATLLVETTGVSYWIGFCFASFLNFAKGAISPPKALQAFWGALPFAVGALSFAFFYGVRVAPILIHNGSVATVSVSQEGPSLHGNILLPGRETKVEVDPKESIVKGRIIFRLPHSLLLLSDHDNQTMIVLPQEKIEKIEMP